MKRFARLDDLSALVGQEFAHSDELLVDQARIDAFANATGDRQWIHIDPARAAVNSVTATVETGTVATNVAGFGAEISDKFLGAKANPTATFTSTAFRQTDATHGQVEGTLTLMGKTAPMTFDVVLVGAGKGFGKPRIGMTARGWIKPSDFGMAPIFADPIELVIDAEFEKQG